MPQPRKPVPTEEVVPAYLAGDTIEEIAARHHVSCPVARRALLDAGIELRRRGPRGVPDALPPQIHADHLGGMTADEIATKHGFTRWAVVNALQREGVTMRRGGAKSNVDVNDHDFAAAYAGATIRDLTALYGAADRRIRRAII